MSNNNEFEMTIPFEELNKFGLFRLVTDQHGLSVLRRSKMVYVFGDTGLLITTDDDVYSIGPDNGWDPNVTNALGEVTELSGKGVKDFFVGAENFVFAITENGCVYSWGMNDSFQLGRIVEDVPTYFPGVVKGALENVSIINISASEGHVLALSETGEVYGWGKNENGELGIGHLSRRAEPTLIEFFCNRKTKMISCADSISAALCEEGKLYCWGSAGHNGRKDIDILEPRLVPCSQEFIQVVCVKRSEVYAISKDGILYKLNRGVNTSTTGCFSCRNDCFMVPVTDIKGTVTRIATVPREDTKVCETAEGRIYLWGKNIRCEKPTLTRHPTIKDPFIIDYQVTFEVLRASPSQNNNKVGESSATKMWEDKTTADVFFLVEGQEIMAHKVILKSRSDYFSAMFSGDYKEAKDQKIRIDDISLPVFKAFVKYIYTGEIGLESSDYEQLFELRRLADSKCETDLRDKCDTSLMLSLSPNNALPWLKLAVGSISAEKLASFGIKYILENRKEIFNAGQISSAADLERILDTEAYFKLISAFFQY